MSPRYKKTCIEIFNEYEESTSQVRIPSELGASRVSLILIGLTAGSALGQLTVEYPGETGLPKSWILFLEPNFVENSSD